MDTNPVHATVYIKENGEKEAVLGADAKMNTNILSENVDEDIDEDRLHYITLYSDDLEDIIESKL